MSSPAGLRFSRADFLARWTPSSTRAGVILSPGPPDVADSLGLAALEPDDSFGSDFAPLPGSADSSCLGGGDGPARSPGGEQARDEGPVSRLSYEPSRPPQGRVDRLEGMADKAQDLPVMVKLDQLRKWQQHMQEQLKAHQLEELLRLQEEQQRLLGKMTGSQHGTGETSCLSGAEWEDDSVQGAGDYTDTPGSPLVTCPGVPPGASCGPREDRGPSPAQSQERLPRGPGHPELEDSWLSRGDDEERDDTLTPGDGVAPTGDDSRDEVFYERPIKPGIGGQTKTFEELLEEQLRVEEQRMKSARQQQSQDGGDAARAPKQPFLKRGDGLSRFSNTRKASLPKLGLKKVQTRVISRSHSEPAALQRGNILQRLPVQRKTATLNKENRLRGVSSPPQDVRAETKAPQMKVLGSHQRHNTPEPIQTDTDGRKTKPPPPRLVKEQNNRKGGPAAQVARNASANRQQNPVGVSRGPEKAQHAATAAERWRGSTGGDGVPQEEASIQELRRWDCERRLESMELGEFELLEQAAEELSFSSNSSFVIKVLQMDQHHRGLHPRRLSSTPIKSTPLGAGECSSDGGSLNSVKTRDDALEDEEEQETHGDHDEVSSRGGSEVEDQDVAVRPPSFPSILCFPAHTNPPYDKRSYQDEDSCRGSASDGESTLMEEDGHQGRVVFDDDDTWNDLEDAVDGAANGSRAVSPDDEVTLPGRTLVKKGSNVVDLDQDMDQDTGPPPASQLMTRLFPSLKPKTQNAPLPPSPPHAAASESKKSEETTGQQVQSRQLRERLVELEIEIQRFKKENAALAALRRDNEETQQQLRKERSAFEQLKAEELAKFEEHKREENRKLQKERKLFERHAAAARAVPDKKEREEIQALKQQLSSLQEELRGREGRWASSHSRLRQQVDSLSQENASLRDEIRVLEKLRLSTLKKTAIITDDETKDGRSARDNSARDNSARENSVSSVAKGVKFASPLDSRGGTSSNSPPQSNAAAASTRSSKGASAGMKSSLRRSSGPPSSSSSSLPGRRTEDSRNQDKPPHQDSHDSSPKGGFLSGEAEEREPTEEVVCPPDGKVETVLAGGDRLIVFNNGTKKEVSADGLTVKVTFFNGDTKEVTADQRVIYFYADAKTTHITYPDGMEVLHFPNNQTEKLFPDGRKEITFPDQTVKNLFPGGGEESVLTDGTIIRVNPDATKEILFNTGQKEIHTADYKRREYPDGTVKTVYADGRQETRYPTGRLRIKDRDGNVLLDNGA